MHASLPGKKLNSFLVLILVMLPLGPYKHGRLSSKQNMLYLKYTHTHTHTLGQFKNCRKTNANWILSRRHMFVEKHVPHVEKGHMNNSMA